VLSALALVVLLAAPSAARADGTLRTVLVIDASSSMLSTDPKELRKAAAELFVDLARYGDEIAVTGFDGGARDSTGGFVAIRSPDDRNKLKAAIRAVGKDGAWTDFTQGLAEARRLLATAKKEPGDQSFVVFLTDGYCDPDPKGPLGEAARAAKAPMQAFCKQRVLDESVPGLKDARLYAVGLSRSAPRDFLEEIARRTGGVGMATDKAEELPHMFADVYARLLGSTLADGATAETVPIVIEEGAQSLDVAVVGPRTLTARLFRPDGSEVPTNNARPEIEYFVDAPEYRFFKVALPAVGAFQLKVSGGKGRYAALQNLDLRLAFVDPPAVQEVGAQVPFRVRLATPGGRVPNAAFLDRHAVAIGVEHRDACPEALPQASMRSIPRGADSLYGFTLPADRPGHLCLFAQLTPGQGGVLTRRSKLLDVRLVPPVHLAGAPLAFGKVKQGTGAKATLDLGASQIGLTLEASLAFTEKEGLRLSPAAITLPSDGARTFECSVEVDRDAPPGLQSLVVTVGPTNPRGFEGRAIQIPVTVDVVPLTFWERYGAKIEIGTGVLVLLFLLFGIALPPRFKRSLVLHYKDVRDPEMPRESSYPIGVKARAGFYRGAKLLVAATGPVRAGGVLLLRPAPGGGVVARPLGGQKVLELPREDTTGMGATSEPREVPLTNGTFRCAMGARYEIVGAGLVVWFRAR
jgi:Mg-chelatase subunit ChlD